MKLELFSQCPCFHACAKKGSCPAPPPWLLLQKIVVVSTSPVPMQTLHDINTRANALFCITVGSTTVCVWRNGRQYQIKREDSMKRISSGHRRGLRRILVVSRRSGSRHSRDTVLEEQSMHQGVSKVTMLRQSIATYAPFLRTQCARVRIKYPDPGYSVQLL